ncbi:erythroid differentiation-related factor 1-like isoform X1 [Branchiostoma floridae x Branchiostoma japonicum]
MEEDTETDRAAVIPSTEKKTCEPPPSPSQDQDVKSTAVMKYASVESPVRFSVLQKLTDLKLPPANWLRSQEGVTGIKSNVSWGTGSGEPFSSLSMANTFLETVDEVDVITDAENIKKLLKIPFSKGSVSLAVHRVGRTLLLDEFDIYSSLLRAERENWRWLRDFYLEHVLENVKEKEKIFSRKKKTRDHLQNRSMFSKFLYRSIEDGKEGESPPSYSEVCGEECEEEGAVGNCPEETNRRLAPGQSLNNGDLLPEPEDPSLRSEFQRNVIWTFEDIRMLIGTDMPIFGGGTHPAVSLRLRDMKKPINVLTGLDYWLDNLMCNVPELVMCYHLEGVVQQYELIKTEEIPNLDASRFSPQVIKDIAQNILSFLKSNCTKEGHTYWLLKGNGDDVVKLYDLTTLCSENMEDKTSNPFSVPVAMLLYRVARNMLMDSNCHKQDFPTVRKLLKQCIDLLDEDKHPEIVTSANYLLSDLFVPDDPNEDPCVPASSDTADQEFWDSSCYDDNDDDDVSQDGDNLAVAVIKSVEDLYEREKYRSSGNRPPHETRQPMSVEERARAALSYVSKALLLIDSYASKLAPPKPAPFPSPSKAIPLHYAKLFQNGDDSTSKPEAAGCQGEDQVVSEDTPSQHALTPCHNISKDSWEGQLKILLLKKAATAYFALSDVTNTLGRYGCALRYLRLALLCYDAFSALSFGLLHENRNLQTSLLTLAGDVQLMMAKHIDNHQVYEAELEVKSQDDAVISRSAKQELTKPLCSKHDWATEFSMHDIESCLETSVHCYEEAALKTNRKESHNQFLNVNKRLGNVQNEMGVILMNRASGMEHGPDQDKVLQRSLCAFESGIGAFRDAMDTTNIALLHSNTGRLMRVWAQSCVQQDKEGKRGEFSQQERVYYNKARDHYMKAIHILKDRSAFPMVWDSVQWELSTTFFTMATLLQDFAPLSVKAEEQVEKEVVDLMTRSIRYCDTETESPRQPLAQYRAATIHHRLASMFHNAYRNQSEDQKRKQARSQAEHHYGKACRLFQQLEHPCELTRVQLERVALCEYQLGGQTTAGSKVRTLSTALGYMAECREAMHIIYKELGPDEEDTTPDGENTTSNDLSKNQTVLSSLVPREESEKLLNILESRLQHLLHTLIKTAASGKASSHKHHGGKPRRAGKANRHLPPSQLEQYKKVYASCLRGMAESSAGLMRRVQNMADTLALLPH